MAAIPHPTALRIACHGLADEEVAALRRLLGLIQSHLPQPCALAARGEAPDVLMVNLDADLAPANTGSAAVVGCSLRPRLHPEGTLYRPIRAYQLLSLLTGFAGPSKDATAATADPAPASSEQRPVSRYRLRVWPAQAMDWPPKWWMVMSTIRSIPRTTQEIAVQTGVAVDVIEQCIVELEKLGAIECESVQVETHESAPTPPVVDQRWRALTRRVGQILGFAR